MTYDQMATLVEGFTTKADKMRVLERAGIARADIARFLGVRYQQVRNTLEGDKRTGYSPVLVEGPRYDSAHSFQMDQISEFVPLLIGDDGLVSLHPAVLEQFNDVQLFSVSVDGGLFVSSLAGMAGRVRLSLNS